MEKKIVTDHLSLLNKAKVNYEYKKGSQKIVLETVELKFSKSKIQV